MEHLSFIVMDIMQNVYILCLYQDMTQMKICIYTFVSAIEAYLLNAIYIRAFARLSSVGSTNKCRTNSTQQ